MIETSGEGVAPPAEESSESTSRARSIRPLRAGPKPRSQSASARTRAGAPSTSSGQRSSADQSPVSRAYRARIRTA